jgi:hypothetical protein
MISPASSDLMNSAVPHGSVEVLSGCTGDLLRHRGKPVFVLYVFDIRAACLRTYWGEWRCDRCRKAFPTLASVMVLLLRVFGKTVDEMLGSAWGEVQLARERTAYLC